MKPAFGTLEWGKKNNGVLTRTEQFHFLRNMAFLAAREVTDVIRAKLGLLKPVNLDLSDLAPPDTRMVKDTEEFARDTHTQDLLSHGYPAGDLQVALLSNEEMAPGSRLDIGRKLSGGLPERIWIHDIK
jgi:hypothetical protein